MCVGWLCLFILFFIVFCFILIFDGLYCNFCGLHRSIILEENAKENKRKEDYNATVWDSIHKYQMVRILFIIIILFSTGTSLCFYFQDFNIQTIIGLSMMVAGYGLIICLFIYRQIAIKKADYFDRKHVEKYQKQAQVIWEKE